MNEETDEALWRASLPEAARQVERIRKNGTRFVHYTSAEAGIKILRSGKMLLRNSTLMNDFSEVAHGMDCLTNAYNGSPAGEKLKELMRRVQPDLPEILQNNFNELFFDLRNETYLLSVSEHGDPEPADENGDPKEEPEDRFGRLSMWRAYANCNGVAFVFNNTPFVAESNALNAFTSPVIYETTESFVPYFAEMVSNIEANMHLIEPAGGAYLHELLTQSFRFATQSTKHPSFREEREWRVLYSPSLLVRTGQMDDAQSKKVPTEIMVIHGVPQRVYAIPFSNHPEEDFLGATIPELFDRILIGPSPDAHAIGQAFVAELSACGVEDAQSKVQVTNIPLRT